MNDIYKAVIRTKTSYLVHFNKKHYPAGSSKGGQFAPSDGGGSVSTRTFSDLDYNLQENFLKKNFGDRKVNKWREANGMIATGYGSDRDIKKAEKFKDKIEKKADQKFQEQHKQDRGIDGDSAKSDKDIIPYEQVSGFLKNQKLSAIRGKISIDHGTDLKTGKEDFNVVGQSTSKVWKEEVKTKNGVHIIQTHPTYIDFGDVAHDSGKGIDRNKLKTLDSFSVSKDSNKAVYSGKDFIVDKKWDSMEYDAVASGGGKKDLGSKKSNARNFNPSYISYGFDKNGKPKVKSIEYKPTYSTYGFDSTSEITVLFDDKGKPYKILEDE